MNGNTGGNRIARRAGILAAVAAAATLASACGSSAPSSDSGTASVDTYAFGGSVTVTQVQALARCMRSHGAPGFPSPSASGSFTLTTKPNGPRGAVDIDSSHIVTAYGACRHLLSGGGPSIAELRQDVREQQQKQRQAFPALVSFAKCMRSHGVPNFPIPQPGGKSSPPSGKESVPNPTSPRFRAAEGACQHLLPAGTHISIQKHESRK